MKHTFRKIIAIFFALLLLLISFGELKTEAYNYSKIDLTAIPISEIEDMYEVCEKKTNKEYDTLVCQYIRYKYQKFIYKTV